MHLALRVTEYYVIIITFARMGSSALDVCLNLNVNIQNYFKIHCFRSPENASFITNIYSANTLFLLRSVFPTPRSLSSREILRLTAKVTTGLEPTIPANKRPQPHATECVATGIRLRCYTTQNNYIKVSKRMYACKAHD